MTASVIEIIGPAGAGKSTVTRALASVDEGLVPCAPPSPRDRRNLPFFASNLALSAATVMRLALRTSRDPAAERRPLAEEIAGAVFLQGWSRLLDRRRAHGPRALLLDQGPLYLLAELWGFGPRSVGRGTAWWDRRCRHWADTLDAVVYLDAPDAVLVPRIRARPRHHRAKHMSDREAAGYLAQWRRLLDLTLQDMLGSSPSIDVIRIDTAGSTPEEIAGRLQHMMGGRDDG